MRCSASCKTQDDRIRKVPKLSFNVEAYDGWSSATEEIPVESTRRRFASQLRSCRQHVTSSLRTRRQNINHDRKISEVFKVEIQDTNIQNWSDATKFLNSTETPVGIVSDEQRGSSDTDDTTETRNLDIQRRLQRREKLNLTIAIFDLHKMKYDPHSPPCYLPKYEEYVQEFSSIHL